MKKRGGWNKIKIMSNVGVCFTGVERLCYANTCLRTELPYD
jgi:hypothetical protein